MADRWGIDESYLDSSGHKRMVKKNVVARLRHIIGDVSDDEGVVVARPNERVLVGRGILNLEDGNSTPVTTYLPADLPIGYHHVVREDGKDLLVIATPGRCYLPDDWRAWGWSAQVYAARSRASWGMGDLGDLKRITSWSRRLGAGFVLINPLGAVAPSEAQQPSPYYPSSRRFRNPLYLCIDDIPGAGMGSGVVTSAGEAGRSLNQRREIDRDAIWRIKRSALEAIWRAEPPPQDFERWRTKQGLPLEQFATWCVLVESHGNSWHDWPMDCRHPDGSGVAAITHAYADRIRFHAWLQWLIDLQLSHAANDAPIIQDLPIGIDPQGFDAWAWQDLLALDVTVGAPPDELNQAGQDWGLPPFFPGRLAQAQYEPFIQTIRSMISTSGGLRIDHVMGLFRLWWIPKGSGAADGAFVRYSAEHLLAILALESVRAQAIVVGEDLGTVEETARTMLADHNVLSYRLLWFEEKDPSSWPARTMAAVSTHDLPTVAGLWDDSDLTEQLDLGLDANVESTRAIRTRLAEGAGLGEFATTTQAVVGAYELLSRAPSILVSATLDDAIVETRRPNIPGADANRPNWALALPVPLEEIEAHPVAAQIASMLEDSVRQED